jgi:ribosomal protein S1
MFPVGTRMQVLVIGSDKQSRKVSLSRSAVSEKAAQDEFTHYRTQQKGDDQASSALGSFGALLQEHLHGKKA